MENRQICCGGRSSGEDGEKPPVIPSQQYPWFVVQDSQCKEDTDQIIFNPSPPDAEGNILTDQKHYHCRIPELRGREIRACFHGWCILSKYPNSLEFGLWNPISSKFIHLPSLTKLKSFHDNYKVKDDIEFCCLSSPPSDPDSVVLLTRISKPNLIFCLISNKRKRLIEMSYAHQLSKITLREDKFICQPVCCNGKVYVTTLCDRLILLDIKVNRNKKKNEGQVVINLLPFLVLPFCRHHFNVPFLIGSCRDFFTIILCYEDTDMMRFQSIKLFKLNISAMLWEEMKSAKEHAFFLAEGDYSQIYCSAIGTESGGYVHILRHPCKLFSYNIADKTISLLSLPCPRLQTGSLPRNTSSWIMPESRFVGDDGKVKCRIDAFEEQHKDDIVVQSAISGELHKMNEQQEEKVKLTEGHLLNIPIHILELIADHCVAVDYLNFRVTCKRFQLAAPSIRWSTATALMRLQKHSLVSPWLMVWDQDVITFVDPKFGDKYFMTTRPKSIGDALICASRFGWLLMRIGMLAMFFNPLTRAIIGLPLLVDAAKLSFSFSAPPTSPDCIVIGFGTMTHITSPGNQEWRRVIIDPLPYNLSLYTSLAFCGKNLYFLFRDGELGVLRIDTGYGCEFVAEPPQTKCASCVQHFLLECSNDLLSVIVDEYGECVKVFKLNNSSRQWETVDDLGNHMIYVWGTTSFCTVAKTPGMENKMYFPRYNNSGSIVFYSLDTCTYHTFGERGKVNEEASTVYFSTKEQLLSAWIEPNWCVSD